MKRSWEESEDESHKRQRKIAAALVKSCPDSIVADKQEWANEVCKNLEKHYSGQELWAKARSLAFNLKRNGDRLVRIRPSRLVTLSADEMAQGTQTETLRENCRLSGWEPPPCSSIKLPGDSRWYKAIDKRLVLVLNDDDLHRNFLRYFGNLPRVEVVKGDITAVEGECDAFVSPANTMGNMDGGIDRVIADYLGWSYGRPYHLANPLQLAIDELQGETDARLPIGQAILVKDKKCHLIAVPTMVLPSKIPVNSRIVHNAALAAFAIWRDREFLRTIRMPAFGTGYGRVPGEVAAAQMLEAFCTAWS